jgi:hypothetical protein
MVPPSTLMAILDRDALEVAWLADGSKFRQVAQQMG